MNKTEEPPIGLYVHIPYCKQACSYCNFYFSTNLQSKSKLINALCCEISLRKEFGIKRTLKSIYFGGGTPSLLNNDELARIFKSINNHFDISNCQEITLECNPDDITEDSLLFWRNVGINRLSIGIQSFNDVFLTLMNRSHSGKQAYNAIEKAQKAGFENLTIDIIYGISGQTEELLKIDLEQISNFNIGHFSAYALTVEPKTLLHHQISKGLIKETSDEIFNEHFKIIKDFASKSGFEHYEISNFAKSGKRAIHNSAYWKSNHYIGIGPSAHSYNGHKRMWNLSNIHTYIKAINENSQFFDDEILTKTDHYNEFILTRIRTIEGVNLTELKAKHADFCNHFVLESNKLLKKNLLKCDNNIFTLTNEGQFLCDYITSELMA